MNCLNVYGPTVVNENASAYLNGLNEMCLKMGVTNIIQNILIPEHIQNRDSYVRLTKP